MSIEPEVNMVPKKLMAKVLKDFFTVIGMNNLGGFRTEADFSQKLILTECEALRGTSEVETTAPPEAVPEGPVLVDKPPSGPPVGCS